MFYTVCLTKLNLAFTLEASIRAGPAPAIATASTKQYHAATPLGGLPCVNPEAGCPRTGSN
jgi:hypothetical protein